MEIYDSQRNNNFQVKDKISPELEAEIRRIVRSEISILLDEINNLVDKKEDKFIEPLPLYRSI